MIFLPSDNSIILSPGVTPSVIWAAPLPVTVTSCDPSIGEITIHFTSFGLSTRAVTSTVVGAVVVTPYATGIITNTVKKIRVYIRNVKTIFHLITNLCCSYSL